MSAPYLKTNLSALAGQEAFAWLTQAPPDALVESIILADNRPLLIYNGQSQSSRIDPQGAVDKWLAAALTGAGSPGEIMLFGLGDGRTAESLLKRGHKLTAYEPSAEVARLTLAHFNFQPHLSSGLFNILAPNDLAANTRPAFRSQPPHLLIHPPAQRRALSQLINLQSYLAGPKNLTHLKSRPEIMIIPPVSGGSAPMAAALHRAALRLGHQAHYVDWGPEVAALDIAARKNDINGLTPLKEFFKKTETTILELAEKTKPDLIIALAQAPVEAKILYELRQRTAALTAFWFVEDYRLFKYAAEVGPAYDAFFHIQKGVIEAALKNWGLRQAYYLPPAADDELFTPELDPAPFTADISFMGAAYPNRVAIFRQLAQKLKNWHTPPELKIYGDGWPLEEPFKGLVFDHSRRVSSLECAKIFKGSAINLNIHSSLKPEEIFDLEGGFVNPRTFEIAACGGFQLADPRPLLTEIFETGNEIVCPEHPDQLPNLISYYLARPEQRLMAAQKSRNKVLAGHTYVHRLKTILNILGWREDAK